jgi:hypothetical protein
MDDRSEEAMREGVVGAECVVAIVTGPADGSDAESAYFARPLCVQELRWARDAAVAVQPVVRVEDKQRIGELLAGAPSDLRSLGSVDFIELIRSDHEYWQTGLNKLIRAAERATSPRAAVPGAVPARF